jgi:hypothetical protein
MLTFQTVHVLLAISSSQAEFSRSLLRVDHLEGRQDAADTDDWFSTLVCARYSEIEIVHRQQFRRDVLQFDHVEEFELLLQTLEYLPLAVFAARAYRVIYIPRLLDLHLIVIGREAL